MSRFSFEEEKGEKLRWNLCFKTSSYPICKLRRGLRLSLPRVLRTYQYSIIYVDDYFFIPEETTTFAYYEFIFWLVNIEYIPNQTFTVHNLMHWSHCETDWHQITIDFYLNPGRQRPELLTLCLKELIFENTLNTLFISQSYQTEHKAQFPKIRR